MDRREVTERVPRVTRGRQPCRKQNGSVTERDEKGEKKLGGVKMEGKKKE